MENVFVLISPHTDREEVEKYLADSGLSELKIWTEPFLPDFINPLEPIVILLLSGGTELLVKKIVEKAFSTIFVNCVPMNNSITAGAELNGYYFANAEIKISTYTEETFKLLFNIEKYKEKINKSVLLQIGRPHEWVLTSENVSPPSPFKTKILPVKRRELDRMVELTKSEEANLEAEYWLDKKDVENMPIAEFYNSAVYYLAFKKLLEKYGGNMLTVRCKEIQNTASSFCLALDRLNEEGIICSGQGDIEAAFSLKIIRLLTDSRCWITSISHIDFKDNLLYLTHCPIPLDMFDLNSKYVFDNVQDYDFMEEFLDIRQLQDVTLFRISKDQRYDILEGTVNSEIIGKRNFCRSSIQVQANSSLYEWFDNICGNQQIIVYGKHADQLQHFFDILY